METHQLTACPGCRSTEAASFAYGSASLRRCGACSLVYSSEYADPEAVYVDGYLRGNTEFGIDIMHPHFQQYLLHCAAVRLGRIERVTRPGRLLDVGCGTGEVLFVARERGWEVQGVDPVQDSVDYAVKERDLDVRAALLEESGLPERSYDVVSAFHVLEHMQDGVGFLRLLARWARPGGHVVVEVPNWRSFHRRGHGAGWPGLRPLEHLGHYTPSTMRATLERAGLNPVRIATPGFQWHEQSLEQQLVDLGLQQFTRWTRPLGRRRPEGNDAVPNAVGTAVLRGVQATYNRSRTGIVILAIARVP